MQPQNHSLCDGVEPSVAVTNLMVSKILFEAVLKFSMILIFHLFLQLSHNRKIFQVLYCKHLFSYSIQ